MTCIDGTDVVQKMCMDAESSLTALQSESPRQVARKPIAWSGSAGDADDNDGDNADKDEEEEEDALSIMSMTDDEEEEEKPPSRY